MYQQNSMETKELTTLKGQVSKIVNRAEELVISNQEEYTQAIDVVAKLKEIGLQIKTQKETFTKPSNEILASAKSFFGPVEDKYKAGELLIKRKLLDYKQEQDRVAREKEAKIALQVESNKITIEKAEKKMDSIERVENTTAGSLGKIVAKKIKKVRVIDESLIPRNYLVVDMVAVRRDVLSGVIIPGAEIYEEESLDLRSL